MTKWAIQQADERWLAMDYGWTDSAESALCFDSRDEAEKQANHRVTDGTPCHVVAMPPVPGSSHSVSEPSH